MEKYWKLLDLENQEYTTHETEEEVNHIIDFNTRYLSNDKVTKRRCITTPFPNYNFHFVLVFDKCHVHQFLYFFDSIEEECDDFEERIRLMQAHCDEDIVEKQRQFEIAYEAVESCLRDVIKEQEHKIAFLKEKLCENYDESNQLDALREQISRRNNKIAELQKRLDSLVKEDTSKILSLERKLEESEKNTDYWIAKCEDLKKRLDEIRIITYPF